MESRGRRGILRTTLCWRSTEWSGVKTVRVRTKVRHALQEYESSQNRTLNGIAPNYKRQSAMLMLLAVLRSRRPLVRLHEALVQNFSNGQLPHAERPSLLLTIQAL